MRTEEERFGYINMFEEQFYDFENFNSIKHI